MDNQGTDDLLHAVPEGEAERVRLPGLRGPFSPVRRGAVQRPLGTLNEPALFEPSPAGPSRRLGRYDVPPGPIIGHHRGDVDSHGVPLRFWVHRRWMNSQPTILWVLCHPGFGYAENLDTVLKRIGQLSWRWGYGGVLAVSLYPAVVRNCDEAFAWRDRARGTDWHFFEEGARVAGQQARLFKCHTRVAAWGRLDDRAAEDLDRWLVLFEGKAPNWCLGVEDSYFGDPLHPCPRGARRIEPDAILVPFEYPVRPVRPARKNAS